MASFKMSLHLPALFILARIGWKISMKLSEQQKKSSISLCWKQQQQLTTTKIAYYSDIMPSCSWCSWCSRLCRQNSTDLMVCCWFDSWEYPSQCSFRVVHEKRKTNRPKSRRQKHSPTSVTLGTIQTLYYGQFFCYLIWQTLSVFTSMTTESSKMRTAVSIRLSNKQEV